MEFVKGLDTSHWSDSYKTEKTIDWSVAKSKGVEFMFTKATEGDYYIDPTYKILFDGAKSANILRGAYHYFTSCQNITNQVNYFWNVVKNDVGELPLVLDVEDNYKNNPLAKGITLCNQILGFMQQIENLSHKTPILYTSLNIIKYYLGYEYATKLTKYPLWLARYIDYTTNRVSDVSGYPWNKWTFWQYTDREEATQYGFNESKTVDANIFNGSLDDLYKFCGINETSQLPPSEKIYSDSDKLNLLWQAHVELH